MYVVQRGVNTDGMTWSRGTIVIVIINMFSYSLGWFARSVKTGKELSFFKERIEY